MKKDLLIIGGGSAGLAAALSAKENGISDILILEREKELGGILQQCLHNGFGLHTFHQELTGPEYAERYITKIKEEKIETWLNATAIEITKEKKVTVISPDKGLVEIEAKALILATGCRERTRGAIQILGTRPQGIYTAGSAQKYLNKEGLLVGKKVFILGSGDIGLIMARRLCLEGAEVIGVAEVMPYSNGLPRNIKQCLDDYHIPLYLSTTVTKISGKENLEKITLSQVDSNRNPILSTQREIDVDTLLLSVGLIPENDLAKEAGLILSSVTKGLVVYENCEQLNGIFSCGNALQVHDLVDYVSEEARRAGKGASDYLMGKRNTSETLENCPKNEIRSITPTYVHKIVQTPIEFSFRVSKPIKNCTILIQSGEFSKKIKKPTLIPSIMEKIVLTPEELSQCTSKIEWEVQHE